MALSLIQGTGVDLGIRSNPTILEHIVVRNNKAISMASLEQHSTIPGQARNVYLCVIALDLWTSSLKLKVKLLLGGGILLILLTLTVSFSEREEGLRINTAS
jgi:hypothetical protein